MKPRVIDVTIPAQAGGVDGFALERVPGRIITCLSASAVFFIEADNGPRVDMATGLATGSRNAPEFGTLKFYNTSAVQVTARLVVSFEPYSPDSAIASINASITTSGKNAPTYANGYTAAIPAGQRVVFANALGNRKSFSVFNNHTTDDLYIEGNNGVLMHIVPARTGFVVETGGTVRLYVPGANAITYAASEVFYT
jgi:hypothetical protein